ncbi:MAG: TPM domain-containing protein [Flavobacteriaceae bacterium]|nr:TPM domain-containing protein [Flavobacteriaceae bacterium]
MAEKKYTYFSLQDEERIIHAIRDAENMTSGEIRVHISLKSDTDALEVTKAIFNELRMYNTRQRNGVLIHISVSSKTFAIYGDEGIHQKVGDDFWEETRDLMLQHFTENQLVTGICEAVQHVGEKLKIHFPWNDRDLNELSDEITYD